MKARNTEWLHPGIRQYEWGWEHCEAGMTVVCTLESVSVDGDGSIAGLGALYGWGLPQRGIMGWEGGQDML